MDESKDRFGDRIKKYEKETDFSLDLSLPVCIRIDGKRFSKFTQSLHKPFDSRMEKVMYNTAISLMEEFKASCAYTQSDEITIVYTVDNIKSLPFNGRIQKICSVFAAKATAYLIKNVVEFLPENYFDKLPCMDARVWNVPSDSEAINSIVWRITDARRNALSSVFRYTYGHSIAQHKNSLEMLDYMKNHGVDYESVYNDFQRTGVLFFKKEHLFNNGEEEYSRNRIETISGYDFMNLSHKDKINLIVNERCLE